MLHCEIKLVKKSTKKKKDKKKSTKYHSLTESFPIKKSRFNEHLRWFNFFSPLVIYPIEESQCLGYFVLFYFTVPFPFPFPSVLLSLFILPRHISRFLPFLFYPLSSNASPGSLPSSLHPSPPSSPLSPDPFTAPLFLFRKEQANMEHGLTRCSS